MQLAIPDMRADFHSGPGSDQHVRIPGTPAPLLPAIAVDRFTTFERNVCGRADISSISQHL